MIKVPFDLHTLDQMADDFYKNLEARFSISTKLLIRPKDILADIFEYLANHLQEVIKGRPERLEYHADQLQPLIVIAKQNLVRLNLDLSATKIKTFLNTEIFKLFNYDHDHNGFTKHKRGNMAYNHAEGLSLNSCVYCNAQFTYTIRKKAKTRPHFDHFYGKSDHPYFALSFYNLIPSCYVCNSNLKGSKVFKASTHLHPFLNDYEALYQFRTGIKDSDFVVDKKKFELKLKKCISADAALATKAEKNIRDFALDVRYERHKDIAEEIIKKCYYYNHTTIKELLEEYEVHGVKLFSSEAEILELLMANRMTADRLHERIFAKLTRDLCDEFDIRVTGAKSY